MFGLFSVGAVLCVLCSLWTSSCGFCGHTGNFLLGKYLGVKLGSWVCVWSAFIITANRPKSCTSCLSFDTGICYSKAVWLVLKKFSVLISRKNSLGRDGYMKVLTEPEPLMGN